MISFFHFDFMKLQVIFDILQVLLISLNQRFPTGVQPHSRKPRGSANGAANYWIIFLFIDILLLMVPMLVIFDILGCYEIFFLKAAVNSKRLKNTHCIQLLDKLQVSLISLNCFLPDRPT